MDSLFFNHTLKIKGKKDAAGNSGIAKNFFILEYVSTISMRKVAGLKE